MNILMRLVQTRYLIYIEDDWRYIGHNLDDQIMQALCILRTSDQQGVPVHEVLFNEQSQRGCAVGDTSKCNIEKIKDGGWLQNQRCPLFCTGEEGCREVSVSYSLHEPFLNSMNNYYMVIDDRVIRYRDHSFNIWPGLTLNPGVWDILRIRELWSNTFPKSVPMFNESTTV